MAVSINPTLIAQPQGRKLGSHVMCYVSPKTETFYDILGRGTNAAVVVHSPVIV